MSALTEIPPLLGVHIDETPAACTIKADITGFYANSVSVHAQGDKLIVEMDSKHQPGQSYYLGEMEAERHIRSIPLGFRTSSGAVMAHHINGKLEVLVNKQPLREKEPAATAA